MNALLAHAHGGGLDVNNQANGLVALLHFTCLPAISALGLAAYHLTRHAEGLGVVSVKESEEANANSMEDDAL